MEPIHCLHHFDENHSSSLKGEIGRFVREEAEFGKPVAMLVAVH